MKLKKKALSCRPGPSAPYTLAIDIGGTHLKASILDACGRMKSEAVRLPTPQPCTPERLVDEIAVLTRSLTRFDRVSCGFPGVVRAGRVVTAPNLGSRKWRGYPIENRLRKFFRRPVKAVNDADMQGIAAVSGEGLEIVVTLGTGVGTSVFMDGELLPHFELGMAHHPVKKGKTYNEYLGDHVRARIGDKAWNARLARFIGTMREIANFDKLYLGGGNAKRVRLRLPSDVKKVGNEAGILGGIQLWRAPRRAR